VTKPGQHRKPQRSVSRQRIRRRRIATIWECPWRPST